MRRTLVQSVSLIGCLVLAPLAAAAEPPAVDPAVKVPVPVEAHREPAPTPAQAPAQSPAAAPALTPAPAASASPAPAPEQKPAVTDAKDKKGGKKQAMKEKKPKVLAKELFGKTTSAAALTPRSIGWYAKGCLAGGVHLADTGPNWQAMRLSRNRAWGHPKLIKLVRRLASDAQNKDGWPGLLVGDIAQPRGGPMVTGHASHQVGLDADIWLTPMPDRVLTRKEREDIQATTMLDKTSLKVDPNVWTGKHLALIKRAASYPEVERIFVHPAIKKALCEGAGKDRAWLGKVRPLWGHNYHFHIRIGCPNGGCQSQPGVTGDDGCGKELTEWLKNIEKALKAQPKPEKEEKYVPPSERRQITLDQLPSDCKTVLNSKGTELTDDERRGAAAADAKSTASAKQ